MEAVDTAKPPTRHRLTVDEYERMGEAGVFAPEARVELIEGEVIDMAPIGNRHATAVRLLTTLLTEAVDRDRGIVSVQNPLRIGDHSEPQPDLVLLGPRADFYASTPPGAADALLVIEVADSSARFDREIKLPLYARHDVPEVWIVDLDARRLRLCRRPQGDAYLDIEIVESPGPTPIGALPGVLIDLSGILG